MTNNKTSSESRENKSQENKVLCLAQAIMSLRHRVYRMASETAPNFNLKSSELALIVSLGRDGSQSMSDLARACFFSPPNATYIVSSLEKKALVKRVRSDQSSRVVFVNLTPAGQNVFEQTYPSMVRRLNEFFERHLSQDQMQTLERLLARLNAD